MPVKFRYSYKAALPQIAVISGALFLCLCGCFEPTSSVPEYDPDEREPFNPSAVTGLDPAEVREGAFDAASVKRAIEVAIQDRINEGAPPESLEFDRDWFYSQWSEETGLRWSVAYIAACIYGNSWSDDKSELAVVHFLLLGASRTTIIDAVRLASILRAVRRISKEEYSSILTLAASTFSYRALSLRGSPAISFEDRMAVSRYAHFCLESKGGFPDEREKAVIDRARQVEGDLKNEVIAIVVCLDYLRFEK